MTRRRKTRNAFDKAKNEAVTQEMLDARTKWATDRGYTKARWVAFCEALLNAGFHLSLYEARHTVSKYITITDGDASYKVRFSNHRPNKGRELEGDCDFFVGVTHTGARTTEDALKAVADHFGVDFDFPYGDAA